MIATVVVSVNLSLKSLEYFTERLVYEYSSLYITHIHTHIYMVTIATHF